MAVEYHRDRLGFWGVHGDNEVPGSISGHQRLRNKRYNKGLAFTLKERQLLGIQGLLPAVVKTVEQQIEHTVMLVHRLDNNLDKYIYLYNLLELNERLFYNVLAADSVKLLPIVFTPVVGLGCQKYSLIYQKPKGMYITINDKGHVYEVLRNWPQTEVRAICVTDGERVFGFGDLGANGMGIPVGKLVLFTALGGFQPHHCLPITIDVGTNTQWVLDDPLYIGLRQKRVSGPFYYELVDEFMRAVVRRFGQNCLVQFEDLVTTKAFKILDRYRGKYCVFNDDIQGSGCVALAGLMSAIRIKRELLKDNRILFVGAGQAALGIAYICQKAMEREGLSKENAKQRIWMADSKGLIVKNRPDGGLTEHKLSFARDHPPVDTLAEIVDVVKPTIMIGTCAVGGIFTRKILHKMCEFSELPVVFALSNPTAKAECTAEHAYEYTKGRCIFASGAPFCPVEYGNKTFYPGQANNSYASPGVGLGVVCSGILNIPDDLFLISADVIAELCTADDLAKGCVFPHVSKLAECAFEIAVGIMEFAYKTGIATVKPEPKDKKAFIRSQKYRLEYPPVFPEVY